MKPPVFASLLALPFFLLACVQPETPAASYVLMEKTLADLDGRQRTTAKVLVPQAGKMSKQETEGILRQALRDLQRGDPELDAALIWAYRKRQELTGTHTVGKLEWARDKKGWDGTKEMPEAIVVELSSEGAAQLDRT